MSVVLKTICRKWSISGKIAIFSDFGGLRRGFGVLGGVSLEVLCCKFLEESIGGGFRTIRQVLSREIEIPKFADLGSSRGNGYILGVRVK